MKCKTFYVAVLATLGLMATGCQKDSMNDLSNRPTEGVSMNIVEYTVGGEVHREVIRSEEEYNALMLRLMALAREGYEVIVWNGNSVRQGNATKDVVVYTTTSESDAVKWAHNMMDNGYEVTISYNNKTGVYTCTAIK